MREKSYALSQLAELLRGTALGEDVTITGVGTLREAEDGQIAFIEKADMLPLGEACGASALIVPPATESGKKPMIVTEDPRLAFSRVLEIFAPEPRYYPGVHPTAVVEDGVTLGRNVSIGANAFVGQNTIIGKNTIIHPLAYVGHEATIGDDVRIHPQVFVGERVIVGARCTIHAGAAVGADGFGFAPTPQGYHKIVQIGTVIIEDDVDIGANVTIDRATVTVTRIGAGTKLDDGVHIAHNVTMGKNCMLCGQVGVAGSATIGDNVVMGGQAGINPHVTICDNVEIGGKAGVISDITEPGTYSGFPATRHMEQMRIQASARRVPKLLKQVKELKARIEQLELQLGQDSQ